MCLRPFGYARDGDGGRVSVAPSGGASVGAVAVGWPSTCRLGSHCEPARQVPVALAEQAHGGGDEQQADERRVEGERDGDAEAHLLEGDELAGGEAGEDDDDDRRGAGDQAGGGGDAVDDRALRCRRSALQRSWMRLSRNTW